MDIKLIQQQVLVGDPVMFYLTTGLEISGTLAALGREHVIVEEQDGGSITLDVAMIGFCRSKPSDNQPITQSATTKNRSIAPQDEPLNESLPEGLQGLQDEKTVINPKHKSTLSIDEQSNDQSQTESQLVERAVNAESTLIILDEAQLDETLTEIEPEIEDEVDAFTAEHEQIPAIDGQPENEQLDQQAESPHEDGVTLMEPDLISQDSQSEDESIEDQIESQVEKNSVINSQDTAVSEGLHTKKESTGQQPEPVQKDDVVITESGAIASDSILSSSDNPAVVVALAKIKANYDAQIRFAKFDPVDFKFEFPASEVPKKKQSEVRQKWQRIKSIYDHAVKTNELEQKFGRVARVASELTESANHYPKIHTFRRQAAHFFALSEQLDDAIRQWEQIVIETDSVNDWIQLAITASDGKDIATSCYSLKKYFAQILTLESEGAWFIFVDQIRQMADFSILSSINTERKTINDREKVILFEASIYLLQAGGSDQLALDYLARLDQVQNVPFLLNELIQQNANEPSKSYKDVQQRFKKLIQQKEQAAKQVTNRSDQLSKKQLLQPVKYAKGYINSFNAEKHYGFIMGPDEVQYFFHGNFIIEKGLLQYLRDNPTVGIEVRFRMSMGQRGPVAHDVESYRDVVDMLHSAHNYANEIEYQKAASMMRHIMGIEPEHPGVEELYTKWNRFASEKKLKEKSLPKGSGYYYQAKCAEVIEHDNERAVKLYHLAVANHDRTESAIKDLARILSNLGRHEEAIHVLIDYRDKATDPLAIDNLLITLYQKSNTPEKSVPLLIDRIEATSNLNKKIQYTWMIANLYMKQQEFDVAESYLRQGLDYRQGNTVAMRHLAICLLKQDRLDEAENILNDILEQTSDAQAVEVLAAVQQARINGIPTDIDILIETALSDFFTEISAFTKFFLDHSDFTGVPADRRQEGNFNNSDVRQLENRAIGLGIQLYRERSGIYLSAAKILSMLDDYEPRKFYRYLGRSFASLGDAIVSSKGMIDSASDIYCEALAIYDNVPSNNRGDDQDAPNALIRFLYSTLGVEYVPMIAHTHLSLDETIDNVIGQHPDKTRVFRHIAYLIYRSRYAASRILKRLYNSAWREAALDYLLKAGVTPANRIKTSGDFARVWDELRRSHFESYRVIANEFRYITRIELIPSTVENCIVRLRQVHDALYFGLDKHRTDEFQQILESSLDMCRSVTFEESERLCLQSENRCNELMREIRANPTKFSIEQLYSVLESLEAQLSKWLDDLYQRSTPSLTLELAEDAYFPDHIGRIEVQIIVKNQAGRSPAENVELIVSQEDESFSLLEPTFRLEQSLRGGDNDTFKVPMELSQQTLEAEAFSISIFVQYGTRSELEREIVDGNFSIQLNPETEYDKFDNPYSSYAQGGVVRDRAMFYGRDEFIKHIVDTLSTSHTSKSFLLYGQKRSGKSSILYHLDGALSENQHIIILNIDNIGSLLDPDSATPLLYQILWEILRNLKRQIHRRTIQGGYNVLDLTLPESSEEFYQHPAPLSRFNELFENFKDTAEFQPDWQNIRVVILIDEFTYIYGQIVRGALSEEFMKNWKAILQRNYFSAVLAGQDVMPKFIRRFPNEFGIIEERKIDDLDREDARSLIDEPIRIGGRSGESRYREDAIEHIIELSAGNPFYIQIICNRLVEYMHAKRKKRVTKADVKYVQDILIRSLKESSFDNLLNSGDNSPDAISDADALAVLRVIALNTRRISTYSRIEITANTEKPLDEILDDLEYRSVLERERGSYYRIRVGLFKEWLIANTYR